LEELMQKEYEEFSDQLNLLNRNLIVQDRVNLARDAGPRAGQRNPGICSLALNLPDKLRGHNLTTEHYFTYTPTGRPLL
jgi:hypothetical protein